MSTLDPDPVADVRVGYATAAKITGIKVPTLRSMVRRRSIPHCRLSTRIVTFSVRELREWMAARYVPVSQTKVA